MGMTDIFILSDQRGNIIAKRKMAQHLKIIVDDMPEESREQLLVESLVSGFKLMITKDTTAEDWREYCDRCLMVLD